MSRSAIARSRACKRVSVRGWATSPPHAKADMVQKINTKDSGTSFMAVRALFAAKIRKKDLYRTLPFAGKRSNPIGEDTPVPESLDREGWRRTSCRFRVSSGRVIEKRQIFCRFSGFLTSFSRFLLFLLSFLLSSSCSPSFSFSLFLSSLFLLFSLPPPRLPPPAKGAM